MRRSENEKRAFKGRHRKGAKFLKKKKSAIITARKDISLKSVNRLKLIMRKPIILKKKENERFRKNLN
jgi:hypothetical protein